MSSASPRLNLPFMSAAQAQKHVTHNEALSVLDTIVHLTIEHVRAEPPVSPISGACYIIGLPDDGNIWTGKAGQIARYQDGAWTYLKPKSGWLCWNAQAQALLCFSGQDWISVVSGQFERLGVGASPDSTNKFAVKASGSLFDSETTDHRITINKASEANTASLVLQGAYVGHAEIGLSGSNDLSIKVSPNGSDWVEALTISRLTGAISVNTTLMRNGEDVLDRANTPDILNLKAAIPAAADLNNYISTGMWHQPSNSGAASGLNYPGDQAGLLTVISAGAMVYQTYTFFSAAGRGLANSTFTRGQFGGNWSEWQRQAVV